MLINRLRLMWFAAKERVFFRQYRGRTDRFAAIYRKRIWQNPESASGFGSTLAATEPTRAALAALAHEGGVTSILDAPCGDFNWMHQLAFDGDYAGLDIVPDLIAENQRRHGSARRRFAVCDIVADAALPPADLVLCRECLNHLPLADSAAAVANLAMAARKLLVITHYPAVAANANQPVSFRYRPLNLTLPPFGLRPPDRVIDEGHYEPGKVLAVWDMARGSPFAAVYSQT